MIASFYHNSSTYTLIVARASIHSETHHQKASLILQARTIYLRNYAFMFIATPYMYMHEHVQGKLIDNIIHDSAAAKKNRRVTNFINNYCVCAYACMLCIHQCHLR